MRIGLFLLLALCSIGYASDIDTLSKDTSKVKVWWLGKPAMLTLFVTDKLINLDTVVHNWKDTCTSPIVSIGPGIQTITISVGDGTIGIFDVLTPLNVTLNLLQKTFVQGPIKIDFCFFAPSIGFLVSKPLNETGALFGMSLTPYQIKINKFTLGMGIAWMNHEKVGFRKENFFVTIPLTYTVDVGN
jgi:hypothetical protein